ncbi:hypothetical protein TSOC_014442 [Tetrabaena socialis]|uniref:Uncharacterized protein n=1 Tax=Tetrabaena socialis TaxID=47790 RepID=A0A2J7ZHL8_9CHLO|nr:hypothetical protein TSOC_014442 [Tetrabaena socialis]|eukprot:PNG99773.1 hypothetical protein TSOC_014442 [Tetrabaena socialis]
MARHRLHRPSLHIPAASVMAESCGGQGMPPQSRSVPRFSTSRTGGRASSSTVPAGWVDGLGKPIAMIRSVM